MIVKVHPPIARMCFCDKFSSSNGHWIQGSVVEVRGPGRRRWMCAQAALEDMETMSTLSDEQHRALLAEVGP